MAPWVGSQSVAYIPVILSDSRFTKPPANFKDVVTQHLLFDPDSNGRDTSLRAYLFNVSYGRAILEPTVFDSVNDSQTTINPAGVAGDAISKVLANQPSFQNACTIFPDPVPGAISIPDHAFWGGNPVTGTNVTGFCYDILSSGVGAWAMEHTHMLTSFGDLYGQPADPGSFDNMSCACGVHPSTFTKIKLGWLDASEIVDVRAGPAMTQTLHALALPRPSPPGRCTAFRIPSSDPQHYFLVEARLKTDVFDARIPSEGVVVYEINEATWPPLALRTPVALGVSQSYQNAAFRNLTVTVDAAVIGGFTVAVQISEDPRCPAVRSEINTVQDEIDDPEGQLEVDLPPAERAKIIAEIRALRSQLTALQAELVSLRCFP